MFKKIWAQINKLNYHTFFVFNPNPSPFPFSRHSRLPPPRLALCLARRRPHPPHAPLPTPPFKVTPFLHRLYPPRPSSPPCHSLTSQRMHSSFDRVPSCSICFFRLCLPKHFVSRRNFPQKYFLYSARISHQNISYLLVSPKIFCATSECPTEIFPGPQDFSNQK